MRKELMLIATEHELKRESMELQALYRNGITPFIQDHAQNNFIEKTEQIIHLANSLRLHYAKLPKQQGAQITDLKDFGKLFEVLTTAGLLDGLIETETD